MKKKYPLNLILILVLAITLGCLVGVILVLVQNYLNFSSNPSATPVSTPPTGGLLPIQGFGNPAVTCTPVVGYVNTITFTLPPIGSTTTDFWTFSIYGPGLAQVILNVGFYGGKFVVGSSATNGSTYAPGSGIMLTLPSNWLPTGTNTIQCKNIGGQNWNIYLNGVIISQFSGSPPTTYTSASSQVPSCVAYISNFTTPPSSQVSFS